MGRQFKSTVNSSTFRKILVMRADPKISVSCGYSSDQGSSILMGYSCSSRMTYNSAGLALKYSSSSQGSRFTKRCTFCVVLGAVSPWRARQINRMRCLFIAIYYITCVLKQIYSSLLPILEQFINMEPDLKQVEEELGQGRKRVKENDEEGENGGWIVVRKKEAQLTIAISDYSKVNRFYSHKSLQNYLRYILTQTVPNPMWLSIKRQSLVERIIYIDVEIENNLFENMLKNKQLPFLAELSNQTNVGMFKSPNKIFREDLWESLLCYQTEQNIQEIASNKSIQEMPSNINEELYQKYLKYVLTPQELKTHLYPNKELTLYQDFYQPKLQQSKNDIKNWILIVDCEMVLSEAGFELARTTIVNFQGQVLLDELFKPEVEITNYNTEYSGITKEILDPVTNTIQNKLHPFLSTLLTEKTILVGHSLQNDLRAMKLIHNKVIDSSVLYMRKNGSKFKLKNLAEKILNRKIQNGSHDSLEDCLATLHLIRARIENDDVIRKKEYDLLRDMARVGKKAAVIDYAIDFEMKDHSANHFQKIEKYEQIGQIFKIAKKYLRKDVAIPHLILGRIERHPDVDWADYYLQFDTKFKQFYSQIPKMTIVLVNCQVNPNIRIIAGGQPLKLSSANRNPCFFLAV